MTSPQADDLSSEPAAESAATPEAKSAASEPQLRANIEFAWHSHAALESWTAKLDSKASIFFTINIAGLVALLALRTQTSGRLAQLHGWREIITDVGILLCGIAVIIAGAAIFPLLGRVTDHKTRQDIIYFGHLRHRESADVGKQILLLTDDSQVEQLSRQLVTMAKGNWIKHRLLQAALLVALNGYGAVFTVFMLNAP